MLTQRHMAMTSAISSDFPGSLLLSGGAPENISNALPTWQVAARAAYAHEFGASGDRLRAELAARVRALTDCEIPDGAMIVDGAARRATAAIDGALFQLQGRDLILLRPCAHCGSGRFESPPLSSRADLGHALAFWQPYHAGCAPQDPASSDW